MISRPVREVNSNLLIGTRTSSARIFVFMKKICLTRGKYALVDEGDFEWLNQWKWCWDGNYAVRRLTVNKKKKALMMHRIIIDTPSHLLTDHINHDKLDNRRINLSVCTRGQNTQNSCKSVGISKYKGVCKRKESDVWRARVSYKGKQVCVGDFKKERHAAMAYDLWAKDLYGEFANPNFSSF